MHRIGHLLATAFLCLVASAASARTITVDPIGGDFAAIQPAMDAASNGDIILVAAGEYVIDESISFRNKCVQLRSQAGPGSTTIRMSASGVGSVVEFSANSLDHSESRGASLEGLTLTGGKGRDGLGGAVYCRMRTPFLKNCVLTGNTATLGGGFYCVGANPVLEDCTITNNTAERGGGIYLQNASPTFEGCTFSANSASAIGGGIYVLQDRPQFERCQILDNTATEGGGFATFGSSYPNFDRCFVSGNTADTGGGFLSSDSSYPKLINSLVTGNRARLGGGGNSSGTSYPRIYNTTFTGNVASTDGGGLRASGGSYPRIMNCIFWGNLGGSLVASGGNPRVSFTTVESGPGGGEIFPGDANLALDPRFVVPGSWDDGGTPDDAADDSWVEGDYRLRRSSPAIDAGLENRSASGGRLEPVAPGPDLGGNVRPCWAGVDMGPFEYCSERMPGAELSFVVVERDLDRVRFSDRDTAIDRASSGRLLYLDDENGEVRVLVDSSTPAAGGDASPVDVMAPEISFDGRRVVFSGFSEKDGAWRIYEVGVDGSGLRQVTHGDRQIDLSRFGDAAKQFERYDDLDPCYLPGGEICFSSTRYPETAPDDRLRATNLYVTIADGSDVRRITSERFGADSPTVDPVTGNIVYSRWWRSPELRSPASAPRDENGDGSDGESPSVPPGSPRYGNNVAVPRTDGPRASEPGVGLSSIGHEPKLVPSLNRFRPEVLRGIEEDDFPGINSWFLAEVRPDGTGLAMFSGFHLDRNATQAYGPSFTPNGDVASLFLPETPLIGQPGRFGLRLQRRGITFPAKLGGPQEFRPVPAPGQEGDPLVDEVDSVFQYASVSALRDDRFLVTGAPTRTNDPGAYDVFVQIGDLDPIRVLGERHSGALLDAVPVIVRTPPPVVPPAVNDRMVDDVPGDLAEARELGGTFRFRADNIFGNGPINLAIPNAPPVGQRLFIEFYMNPQRQDDGTGDTTDAPILVRREEVPADGKIDVELPAGVPLFEVLRRPDGKVAVGRDGQIFHVGGMNFGRAAQGGSCIGCHAGHSTLEVPADPSWTNVAPSARVSSSSFRTEGQTQFRPEFLVDRSTDFVRSEWAAEASDRTPTVQLEWGVPIQGREITLHGTAWGRGPFGTRAMVIHRYTLSTFLEGKLQNTRDIDEIVWTAPRPEGTTLPLNPNEPFDALHITFLEWTGSYEDQEGVALAEVVVTGKAVPDSVASFAFLRGDSQCDGATDVSDAMATLGALFLGRGPLCCAAAADVNSDRVVDVSDPITLLFYMFRGGEPPAAPFPECGKEPQGELSCEVEVAGCE